MVRCHYQDPKAKIRVFKPHALNSIDAMVPGILSTLLMEIVLCNVKGYRNTNEGNITVPLSAIAENKLCVVKWILLLATKMGAIDATTPKELMKRPLEDRHGTIQWKRDAVHKPLTCAKVDRFDRLDPDKSTGAQAFEDAVHKGAGLAGLTGNISSHDIRTGTVNDLAEDSKVHAMLSRNAMSEVVITVTLGRSVQTTNHGIRKGYIGKT